MQPYFKGSHSSGHSTIEFVEQYLAPPESQKAGSSGVPPTETIIRPPVSDVDIGTESVQLPPEQEEVDKILESAFGRESSEGSESPSRVVEEKKRRKEKLIKLAHDRRAKGAQKGEARSKEEVRSKRGRDAREKQKEIPVVDVEGQDAPDLKRQKIAAGKLPVFQSEPSEDQTEILDKLAKHSYRTLSLQHIQTPDIPDNQEEFIKEIVRTHYLLGTQLGQLHSQSEKQKELLGGRASFEEVMNEFKQHETKLRAQIDKQKGRITSLIKEKNQVTENSRLVQEQNEVLQKKVQDLESRKAEDEEIERELRKQVQLCLTKINSLEEKIKGSSSEIAQLKSANAIALSSAEENAKMAERKCSSMNLVFDMLRHFTIKCLCNTSCNGTYCIGISP